MMTNSDKLNQTFHIWQKTKLEENGCNDSAGSLDQHLDEQSLLRLANNGGIEKATPDELEHLDNCPLCLAGWAAWCRALSVTDDCYENDFDDNLNGEFFSQQAYGYLEAAASDSAISQALILESSCGTYRLEILPDRLENNQGMIILSKLTGNQTTNVTVRDRTGRIIISGPLENGRLARIHKNLDELDLSIWTVG